MAKNDEEEQEDTAEDSSDAGGTERKKNLRKGVVIVSVTLILLGWGFIAVYKIFFTSNEHEIAAREMQLQLVAEQKLARKNVIRGQWFTGKIPVLLPIPYQPLEGADGEKKPSEKDAKTLKPAEAEEEEGVEKTLGGDIIYTMGEERWIGPKGDNEAVVVVDRLRVGVDGFGNKIVRGRIANQGGKSLAQVLMFIDFTGSGGAAVQSRLVNPLVVSGGLFGDRVQSLKPGDSRSFQVDATDLPSSWSGAVVARIQSHHFLP
ncbi:MAG: hypothetical protein HW380_1237 [Magnetococcales bacterium]|nr:hypothetical protein [Magnetococcales bacterium]HIJ83818.1 hypothetical protein [Magnetococcales bacterium]